MAPERRRSSSEDPKKRSFRVHYFLPMHVTKKKYQVCQAMFLMALNVSKDRVNHVAKFCFEGQVPTETRGGDRISQKYEHKKQKVREFIDKLPAKESHYNRNKYKRIYLDSSLSEKKLFTLYQEQSTPEFRVKFEMFRKIFVNEYNIGFSSPATDCCAQCMRLKLLRKKEKDDEKKAAYALELTIHQKSSRAFYELLRESPPNSVTFCFDLQQVQPLPKTPINDAFYAQQVSLYVFCCVDSKAKNPTFYQWTEDEAGRGSVEIGSALLNYLDSLDLTNISLLRLFCDGCGGQNRNSHVIHALYYWLKFKARASVLEISLTFPVRGHSFLPADRVFGRVEKELRKHQPLIAREEYEEIYEKFGEVRKLGNAGDNRWTLFDIKNLENKLKKIQGISDMKIVTLKKNGPNVLFCGFPYYRFRSGNEKFTKIVKFKSRDVCITDLNEKPLSHRGLPEKKKKSLEHLLEQQFGKNWKADKDLKWYKDLIERDAREELEQTAHCDCLQEDVAVHI